MTAVGYLGDSVAAALATHEADTTNVHGITNTALLETTAGAQAKATAAQSAAVQRANHTGTQSADTLTDGTTNKAFLATERTTLARVVTEAPITPLRYSAVGDGTTLDDAAFTSMFAALPALGGHIYLPSGYNFRLSQALTLVSGLRIQGGDQRGARITNTASDVFTVTAPRQNIHLHDFSVTAGASNGSTGGHVINADVYGFNACQFTKLYVLQNRPDKSTLVAAQYLDNTFTDMDLNSANSRSVPAINLVSTTGSLGDNKFADIRHTDYGTPSTWVFWVEEAPASGTTAVGNSLERINFENPSGGAVLVRAQNGLLMHKLWFWDLATASTKSMIRFDKTGGGQASNGCIVEQCARPSGSLGSGLSDVSSSVGNAVGTVVRDCTTAGSQVFRIDLEFDVGQWVKDCYGPGMSIQSYIVSASIATGGAAGAGASVTRTGNYDAGVFTLTTGTGTAAGNIVKGAWPNGMRSAPITVNITPTSAVAAAAGLYVSSITSTDFTVACANALPASTGSITFAFDVVRNISG